MKTKSTTVCPSNNIEQKLTDLGYIVCGIDEVGRGAWAGPLVMAAVIPGHGTIKDVKDSKKLSLKRREELFDEIKSWAKGIGIGEVTNDEIDSNGMAWALNKCAKRALKDLAKNSLAPSYILLDGHYDFIKDNSYKIDTIIKGDSHSHLIASASIIAKVYRDRYMASEEITSKYNDFCFDKNKGYPSPVHKEVLKIQGPTPLHRISWDILGPRTQNDLQNQLF